MRIEKVKITKLKPNPNNPRIVKKWDLEKLKKSINDFPEMLELREIIVDENYMVLGGNQRYRALKELGVKEVSVKVAIGLTEEQKVEFMLKDNINAGSFDYDMLVNEYNMETLLDFGLDFPDIKAEPKGKDKKKHTCPECGAEF